jgi:hypothetical protein
MHEKRMLQKPVLHVEFQEYMQALLESDDLQGVAPGDVDGAFEHGYGAEGAAELVDLYFTYMR